MSISKKPALISINVNYYMFYAANLINAGAFEHETVTDIM